LIEIRGIGFPVRRLAFSEASVSLVDQFSELRQSIEKCAIKIKTNPSYFGKTKSSKGFLADFYKCLDQMGLVGFTEIFKNEDEKISSINLLSYAKAMVDLPIDQLKKISRIHYEIEESNFGAKDGFLGDYKALARYFNQSIQSKEDSAVAGRFIMLFSSMSKKIMEIKELFGEYKGKTIGFIHKLIDRSSECLQNTKRLQLLDDARRITDYLDRELVFKKIEFKELIDFKKLVNSAKERLLMFYVKNANIISRLRSCNLKRITSRLEIYSASQSVNVDEIFKEKEIFLKEREVFKDKTLNMLSIYDKFTDRMNEKIDKGQYMTPFLTEILLNIENQINDSLFKTELNDVDARTKLKKSLVKVGNIRKLYQNKIRIYEKELTSVSGLVKNQLKYFGKELCEVLLRGNEKEKKSFSKIFFHVYKTNLTSKVNENEQDTIKKYFEGLLDTTSILIKA
jgi:hypothetical protein